jgi:hypothetical protein
MSYARTTQVAIDRTRSEIEALLVKRGADGFVSAWDGQTGRQVLEFRFPLEGGARVVRLEVPMPDPASVEFTRTHTGRPRQASAAATAWEQACRQRWRQTKLVLLAKLEAIECGISTFEREFMPDLVTPDGRTIAEHVLPQLATALDGAAPLALGWGGQK